MADSNSFPQIPATVWWGVRALLNKTPRAMVSEDMLGVELGVQPAAARQYVTELRRVGILSEESRATELAAKWRMADSYAEAVSEILEKCYGEGLQTVASSPSDRAKAIDWFQRQGLGEGSARNKAATYFLLASAEPGESPAKSGSTVQAKPRATKATPKAESKPAQVANTTPPTVSNQQVVQPEGGIFPVNLNLQIHISADASTDQIDAIFSSMRKHLGNARLS